LGHQDFLRDYIKVYESSTRQAVSPHLGETPPFFEKHPVFKRFFYTVLGSRYFNRAWCAHEMELGTNFVFYIPCQPRLEGGQVKEMLGITSTFLWDMFNLSSEVPGEHNDVRDKLSRKFDMRTRLGKTFQELTGKTTDPDKNDALMQLYTTQIRETFGLEAGGDPDLPLLTRESSALQDKISIVLNVLGTGLATTSTQRVSSLTEDEAVCRLMILSLAALDPTVLCTLGKPLNLTLEANKSSWLCKPTWHDLGSGNNRGDHTPPMESKFLSCIRIDPYPEQRWIQLDVFALGEPRPPGEKYRQIASNLTQKGIELGLGRGPPGPCGDLGAAYAGKTDLESRIMLMVIDSLSSWGSGPMYQYWQHQTFFDESRERFNWTIASILECGMSWMLGTARKCGLTPAVDYLETKLRQYFKKDHFEGIEDMQWAETQAGRDAVDAIFSTANWAIAWGATVSSEKKKENMPALFRHGKNGNAMVFLPGHALLQVVVPCPLMFDEYARFNRVWLLRAKDDPFYEKMKRGEAPEWFLQDKAILFTDVEAKHMIVSPSSAGNGLPGWRYRAGVKVHGPP
jgi:hypothetical protein